MTIPKEFEDKIDKLVDKLGRSKEDLVSLLEGTYKEIRQISKDSDNKIVWKKAYNRFIGILAREESVFSSADHYTGQIWGDTGIVDFIEIMKRKAEYVFKTDSFKAISSGLTDRSGTPLDTRKKINFGRDDNPNYGKPFPEGERSLARSVFGICNKGTSIIPENISFFRLNIVGDNIDTIKVPEVGTFVQFRANAKRDKKVPFLDLNSIYSAENIFKEIEPIKITGIREILNKTSWSVFTLSDVPTLYDLYSSDRTLPILIEANVASIGLDPDPRTGNRTLWLLEPDQIFDTAPIPCYINSEIPLKFGLDSRVIFVGRVDKFSSEEDNSRYMIVANGYCPIEEETL